MEQWVCAACGEIIGVYEPVVLDDGSGARTTSRAAEPGLEHVEGRHYHRHCHVLASRARRQRDDIG